MGQGLHKHQPVSSGGLGLPRGTSSLTGGTTLFIEGDAVGKYFGERGLWIESFGQLHTDIYGLSTATATWVSPADQMNYPAMYSAHPIWSFCACEKRTVSKEYGYCRTLCEYAGFEGSPEPIEEWTTAVNEEPIQTHPNFASFAGSPSNPANGSRWVDEDGKKSTDDAKGIFEKFWSNPPNEFAGVTSYFSPVSVLRITQVASSPTASTSMVGHLYGGQLVSSVSITRRGNVYQTVTEYRAGGRRGWNASIYS